MSDYEVYISPQATKELKDTDNISSEVRRVHLDKWRVLYMVTEAEKIVDIFAIRKRPPYDYGDLSALLSEL